MHVRTYMHTYVCTYCIYATCKHICLLDRCLRHRGGEPDQAPEFHAGAYFV